MKKEAPLHIFCRGRARGFTHDVFEHGWRVALAWYDADYYRRFVR